MTGGKRPWRLLQLSDSHLPADPAEPYRGVSADRGLDAVLDAAAEQDFDSVLLTGDVSECADAASYSRAAEAVARLGLPVAALPGNHDSPEAMRARFPVGPWEGPAVVRAGAWRIVLLDSTVPGRVDGRITESDLSWLEQTLQDAPGDGPVLLALHHQPVSVGSPWIDRYRLADPGPLLELIERHRSVRGMVWGHVHQEFETRHGNARLLACPSTAANSLPGTERFTSDPAGPAGRWLNLGADGSLETGLLWGAGGRSVSAGAAPARV